MNGVNKNGLEQIFFHFSTRRLRNMGWESI